jgi:hypothetical protein
MIVYSTVRYTPQTLFPGFSALLPCLGSVFIIGAGEAGSSLVAGALSSRPLVFIGLISYSIYLWHWPVIVFQKMGVLISASQIMPERYAMLISTSRFDVVVELTLSMLLAILSWKFVERPFQSGRLRLSGWPLFTIAVAAVFVFVTFSSAAILNAGWKSRFPPKSVQLASYLDEDQDNRVMREGTCFIDSSNHFERYMFDSCLSQDKAKKNYLLLGDSHSAILWAAMEASLPNAHVMQASTSGCLPFVNATEAGECRKMMDFIYQNYLPAHPVQGIILQARWQMKNMGKLAETLSWADQHHVPVILFGPVPEYDAPLPRLLAYSVAWNKPDLARQHRLANGRQLDAWMQNESQNKWHVRYVSLYQEICDGENCKEFADAAQTIPLMSDTDHLNRFGSSVIVGRLLAEGKLNWQ